MAEVKGPMTQETVDRIVKGALHDLVDAIHVGLPDHRAQAIVLELIRTLNRLTPAVPEAEDVMAQIQACRFMSKVGDAFIRNWNLNAPPEWRIDPVTCTIRGVGDGGNREGGTDKSHVH